MPDKVQAAVLVDTRKVEIQQFDLPSPTRDALLLKMEICGVCGTDIHLFEGRMKIPLPVILGHEFSGEIVELGEEARTAEANGQRIDKGDRVTVVPGSNRFCGECYYCRFVPSRPNLCTARRAYGISISCRDPPHLFGGWSEYIYVDPIHFFTFKLPSDFPEEFGALIEPAAVATRALERAVAPGVTFGNEGFGLGKSVVVQGVGPIGLLVTAAARTAGAGKVIVIDSIESRLKMSERMGADIAIDMLQLSRSEDRINEVRRQTQGVGADVVVECTGVPAAFQEGIEMVRDGGKYVEVGHYTDAGPIEISPHRICRKDLDILGSWAYPPIQFSTAISFLNREKDRFKFADLITHRFHVSEATRIFETVKKREAVKPAVVP
jgi:L-iditol 2-dehydrogenase